MTPTPRQSTTPQGLTVIQHHPAEGVGEIGLWAHARGVALTVYRADLGKLPPAGSGPLILLGGPYPADAGPDWLATERTWLGNCLAQGAPVMGICLGAQLLCLGLGGGFSMMAQPEYGWTPVQFADGRLLDVMQWHDDQFTPPASARSLARSTACAHQVYVQGGAHAATPHHIGMQFHPEWNAALVGALNAHFGAESPLPRELTVQDHARFAKVALWFWPQLDKWRQAATTATAVAVAAT